MGILHLAKYFCRCEEQGLLWKTMEKGFGYCVRNYFCTYFSEPLFLTRLGLFGTILQRHTAKRLLPEARTDGLTNKVV
jgi:hypothetical protein